MQVCAMARWNEDAHRWHVVECRESPRNLEAPEGWVRVSGTHTLSGLLELPAARQTNSLICFCASQMVKLRHAAALEGKQADK